MKTVIKARTLLYHIAVSGTLALLLNANSMAAEKTKDEETIRNASTVTTGMVHKKANATNSPSPSPQAHRTTKPHAGKTTAIDLRSKTRQMKFKDGSNLVYQGANFKLTAIAAAGKVSRWNATDNHGKPLPTTVGTTVAEGVLKCEVCVTIQTGGGGSTKTCTVVDCGILEKANPPAKKA